MQKRKDVFFQIHDTLKNTRIDKLRSEMFLQSKPDNKIPIFPSCVEMIYTLFQFKGRELNSVALHGNGGSSCAVMTFDLMDHENGDQQAHELERQEMERGHELKTNQKTRCLCFKKKKKSFQETVRKVKPTPNK